MQHKCSCGTRKAWKITASSEQQQESCGGTSPEKSWKGSERETEREREREERERVQAPE